VAKVNTAIAGSDIYHGTTALIWASYNGHLDVNASTTNDDDTALMGASQEGHLKVVRQLCERGANVNAATTNGYTALIWASLKGHLEIVRELCARGAV